MDYSEFQMFKEMGIYHLDTGATHGSFLNRNDADEELDIIFKEGHRLSFDMLLQSAIKEEITYCYELI